MREVFLVLVGVGVIAPYTAFVPWVLDHGPNIGLFIESMFENRIAGFFALDVIVSAVVLIVAAVHAQWRGGKGLVSVIAATLLIGVSAGLPLYIYHRLRDPKPRQP